MAIENGEAISEDALFDGATSPEPSPAPAQTELPLEPTPTPNVAAPADTKPADAPKADARPPVDDDAAQVPSWRVREINEEKRTAQAERDALKAERDRLAFEQQEFRRRLAQLEQPAPKAEEEPDPLLDPKGFRQFMEKRVEERLVNERREYSLQLARRTYKEEFDQAYEAARRFVDPGLRARMQQSGDPGETLMGWFRDLKVRAEVGDNPATYKQRLREELLKDADFRKTAMEAWRTDAASSANGRPNVELPPSLSGVSRSSAALRASQDEVSDDALWDNTLT